jgi:hypothetical protein
MRSIGIHEYAKTEACKYIYDITHLLRIKKFIET